jgi:CheY-like chemotaxis protein
MTKNVHRTYSWIAAKDLVARRGDIRFLSATDGHSGVELAIRNRPDVILMDINLPGLNGVQALHKLALNPLTARIPVIALSANAMPADIARGLDAGFFRYITKPIRVPEFMATLDEALHAADPPIFQHIQGQGT